MTVKEFGARYRVRVNDRKFARKSSRVAMPGPPLSRANTGLERSGQSGGWPLRSPDSM